MKEVFVVIFDWKMTEENTSDIEVDVFSTYNAALEKFNTHIDNELDPELSWVGDITERLKADKRELTGSGMITADDYSNLDYTATFRNTPEDIAAQKDLYWCVEGYEGYSSVRLLRKPVS